jgi:hypothetical protein
MDYNTAYGTGDGYGAESQYFYDDVSEGVIPVPNRNRTVSLTYKTKSTIFLDDQYSPGRTPTGPRSHWLVSYRTSLIFLLGSISGKFAL